MFQSFRAQNFRCFKDVTMESLDRVNLIAGINNVGKTALLEAIYLHIGPNNPALPVKINVFRGVQQLSENTTGNIWSWLFYNQQKDTTIKLSAQNEENKHSRLEIKIVETSEAEFDTNHNNKTTATSVSSTLTSTVDSQDLSLTFYDEFGQTTTSRAYITAEGIKFEGIQNPHSPGRFFYTRAQQLGTDAEHFSKLEAVGRQEEVLDVLKNIEPRLRRLAVLVSGGVPMIYGDIGISRLVPLPLMGEGTVRLLSILLGIANAHGGTILIDEVENGFHHTVMVKVWEAIASAARRSNTQIFATTHSWECIQAAHKAFEASDKYDFRLHRLERLKEDIRSVTYDQEALGSALKAELEVR